MVDEILAKSSPFKTLKEHTKEVLQNYNLLKNLSRELSLNLTEEKWEVLKKACFYHDFGKANDEFQQVIRERKRKKVVPHNFLSIAFIEEKEKDKDLLIKLIAFHHWRDCDLIYNKEEILKIYENMSRYLEKVNKYFENNFELISRSTFKKRLNYLENFYSKRIDGALNIQKEKDFIILLGLLNRIDHASSAGVEVEKNSINKFEITKNFLFKKTKYPWQLELLKDNYKDRSGIVVASTGMGKTEMALLWAESKKTFYTLPIRTSVDFMYKRLKKLCGNNVGLLHSEALGRLLIENVETSNDELFYVYDLAKNLAYNLIVCTPDQLFSSTLKYLGFEKIYSTLSYSKIIIDEIQAYSPHTLAIIIQGLKELTILGGKFLVVTATLPNFVKKEINYDFEIKKIPNLKKHKIKLIKDALTKENVKGIINIVNNKAKKILIVCNTVKKAQDLYISLKEFNPILLHSRFTRIDRRKKEEKVLDENFEGLAIATQVVEVSLDIDFDILITEAAPIDVLIQRMGRIYRKFKCDGDFYPDFPNVYVFTEDISGVGSVYEKELILKSINFLREGVISEEDKVGMVEDFYTEENLKDTRYFTKFNNALEAIKHFSVNKKGEAQKIFRDIAQIEVIPKCLLDTKISEEKESILKELDVKANSLKEILEKVRIDNKNEKNRKNRLLLMEIIKDFLVPIPIYKNLKIEFLCNFIENSNLKSFLSEIKVVDCCYDSDFGIQFVETDNEFFENII